MKIVVKAVGVAIVVFVCVLLIVTSVDFAPASINQDNARIRVYVVDLNGNAIHNAQVNVLGTSLQFYTDNNGLSPLIDLPTFVNVYDGKIKQWYTVNLQISKDGVVDTFVLNCVVWVQNVRTVTVKVYCDDGSNLPFVCYVESPPSEFLESLIVKK